MKPLILFLVLGSVLSSAVIEEMAYPKYNVILEPAPAAYRIPGGTHWLFTKPRYLQMQKDSYASSFPYDLNEAVTWIRFNKISLMDPVSKQNLLVNLLSSDEIKAYLLQPWGRVLSGIGQAGLPIVSEQELWLARERSGRISYSFKPTSYSRTGLRRIVTGTLPIAKISTSPPVGDLEEETSWAQLNLRTIYDPETKRTYYVHLLSKDDIARLLSKPAIREALGLSE